MWVNSATRSGLRKPIFELDIGLSKESDCHACLFKALDDPSAGIQVLSVYADHLTIRVATRLLPAWRKSSAHEVAVVLIEQAEKYLAENPCTHTAEPS